ncbi:thiopeptide-type bacteriocin biosynthesis protein [Allocatelliglobosispora scoriae]|uniref:Thiopeptide-type bacteriocin biosynthesis protein n=1 Tax=Allocatelliglobosispora scoriae TaxID=643052 RepID=A0A841BZ18_9ACTN|nr:thiopeptide-type bacteriocin biosynthesis protein [Allocatelliglobosispora scoriae]MBB5871911.1 thiopeptide-type bacteriocin biosynthesis protein [Allocatelliglobosispora scoriae]
MPTDPLEKGALAILTGAHPDTVAAELALPTPELTAAARTYQAAGRAALAYAATSSRWQHITVVIDGRDTAEQIGISHLAPALERIRANGALSDWWHLRKQGHWRIRYLPAADRSQEVTAELADTLDRLRDDDLIVRWNTGIYEPETEAFGGPAAMEIAHTLFSTDSRCLLRYLAAPAALGRRELMLLLPTVLARAADLDWYEQGQLWADVRQGRTTTVPANRIATLAPAARTLLRTDAGSGISRAHGFAELLAAYTHAGVSLRHLAARGELHRGLRDVCARHIVFAANRWGVPHEDQAQLAATARYVILGEQENPTDR